MPHPVFTVTTEEIQLLNDAQSRELVARLSREELRRLGGSGAAVTWGGDQRAKDGGVDVRVDAGSLVATSGYVPRTQTAYQVKAESFPKSKISPEMAPGAVLRPAIEDLAGVSGAYVIVSTRDNLSDSSRAARLAEMANCLERFGLKEKVVLDFFDSRRVADWVEQFPPIVAWVKTAIGRPLVGWRPYGPWAYREERVEADYILDERVKVFAPNADEGIDVASAINSLRGHLVPRASVRLVGLSGVGKTRLVQALFDDRVKTENAALPATKAIYTDLGDNPTPQPTELAREI